MSLAPQTKEVQVPGFLGWVERVGNKLPHPVILFAYLTLFVLILSAITAGIEVAIPGTDTTVVAVNLLTAAGIQKLLTSMVSNFVNFPALGIVLVTMLGVAVADEAGLFRALFRKILLGAKPAWVTVAVIFIGLNSSIASDAGIIFMPALGALAFVAVGRHPFLGIAAGYSSAASGYFASLLIASHDAVLTGIAASAAAIVPATQNAPLNITINWYIMIASVLVLLPTGVWVTERILAPRFHGKTWERTGEEDLSSQALSTDENKGLKWAGLTTLGYAALILVLTLPDNALFRTETGTILTSLGGIIPIITIAFFLAGFAYGKAAGSIKTGADIAALMERGVKSMAPFIVLAFVAAQLLAVFRETQLATVLAVKGAQFLQNIGFTGVPMLVGFILILAFINLFMYSGSAKWVLLAPVFVPMFGLLGYSPAGTLAAYRIADSSTNVISPLFPYLPLILGLMQKYVRGTRIGTLLSLMMPYSLAFLVVWIILLVVWFILGLPLGPGAGFML